MFGYNILILKGKIVLSKKFIIMNLGPIDLGKIDNYYEYKGYHAFLFLNRAV